MQKVMAAAGIASRRASEDLIAAGRVSVDGRVITELGTRVDKATARIEVDGRRIAVDPERRYLLMNKPAAVVTTARDELGRKTVLDLLPPGPRVYAVGRLDADTQGLLLLTNDGERAHRLAHPRYGIDRVYLAEVAGRLTKEAADRLRAGVRLDDGTARAVSVRVTGSAKGRSQVEIVMREGRKREVRRMLEAVGNPVTGLVRTSFGPIRLGGLPVGRIRELSPEEVGDLQRLVGL
ncbi:MAG: pseudouridine synthase [Actinomycetota bacterium]